MVADDEKKRIQRLFVDSVPVVHRVYGSNRLVTDGITINCNRTAGMETIEFRKYLEDSICPLYPKASDIPGKQVFLMVDIGPGQKDPLKSSK